MAKRKNSNAVVIRNGGTMPLKNIKASAISGKALISDDGITTGKGGGKKSKP